ncbi:hypothetical protein KDAU_05630 [Dictyobacter aurantiacus]|uniref:Uncharacterized protein n=1 Tax=Dictyobacter aurantiacus TaxID=1936993 RepID=A0A401Z8P8_9CHLR|nr:hypothetical protein KDAU_05630 [Dictyobacter aurantiacus]
MLRYSSEPIKTYLKGSFLRARMAEGTAIQEYGKKTGKLFTDSVWCAMIVAGVADTNA